MTREEKIKKAGEIAESYRQKGFHCSESTFRAVSQMLDVPVSEELLRVSSVFRGGGGGFGGRCGVAEAGLMLTGLLYGRTDSAVGVGEYSYLAKIWLGRFKMHFVSVNCCDILPVARDRSPQHNCSRTYIEGAELMAEFLLDAPALLEERRNKMKSAAED